MFNGQVDVKDFCSMPKEYQDLVHNLLTIHTISEPVGAERFSHWITRAPSVEDSYWMAGIVKEEYGHGLRFAKLQADLGIDVDKLEKPPLTYFTEVSIDSWAEMAMFLAVVDRSARFEFEDFSQSSYIPLCGAAKETLREEVGHTEFGRRSIAKLCQDPQGRLEAQKALDKWYPVALAFFGKSNSPKNARYREWNLKKRANEQMRQDFIKEMVPVIKNWGLTVPTVNFEGKLFTEDYETIPA